LLGDTPNKLFFYNGLTTSSSVQILVGRQAAALVTP
jgi:hypothetical protein